MLNSLCHVRGYAGQIEAGLQACQQGIAITRGNGSGDRDPKLVHLYTNLGVVLFRAGRYDETERAYLDALELATKIYGEQDPMVGNLLNNLGVLYVDIGKLDQAQDYYGRALVLFDAAFGKQHPTTGILRTNLAMAYSNDGELDQAEALLHESIEVLEQTLGPDHVDLALSLAELARVHARREQHAEAIPLFERAMDLRKAAGGEPLELADTEYGLGLSLWEQGQRARARALIGEARGLYEQAGGERLARVEEIDAWLAAHGD
ncbi:MAG: tetratricopeptide repeat protein [Myxococcales bacterium]|nr:tetratricopeptide repeat protein [Myxococcales bacterium]